jgi:hypothetical protein
MTLASTSIANFLALVRIVAGHSFLDTAAQENARRPLDYGFRHYSHFLKNVYKGLAIGVPPADSARRRQGVAGAGFMTAPATVLVLLTMHFSYAVCGFVILNFSWDLRFR